ncbi:MAG: hypothetical protein NTV21_07645 [Planctomycetota bacterium]|nr:hypothetical protein [Planctomycetota bacterium]
MQSILKKQFVQLDGPAPTPQGALPRPSSRSGPTRCEKTVKPIVIEGAVRALEVGCSCGETTVIELEFPHA